MAYEVTATRRRPQRFEDLAGQEFVSATLKNAITTGKVAHAYLFSGPRGCGKTSAARILAKALNCDQGPAATPCGVCAACMEITRGSSMDVIEIDGASNTSVNDVRQIKDEVLFPPNSYRYKIYIIDEVHMLSTSAFNALLKTIEEPPPYIVFIFATTELHKVPATIKSRCQQFNFRLVSIESIKDLLAQACSEIGIKAEDEALFWIARESTGSVRDAYTLFDQVAAFSDGHMTFEKIRDTLGLVGVERFNGLCEACVKKDTAEAFESLESILQSGVSIEQFVINIADYMRNLLLIHNGIKKESLLGHSVDRFSQAVLQAWSAVQLERALSLFLQLYRDIRFSLDPRYELELAVSRLCRLSEYVSAVEVKRAIDGAKSVLLQGVVLPDSKNNIADERNEPGAVSQSSAQATVPQGGTLQASGSINGSHIGGGFSASPFDCGGLPSAAAEIIENPFASLKKNWERVPAEVSIHQVPNADDEVKNVLAVDEKPLIAEMPTLPIEELREKVIAHIKLTKTMLATILEQTGLWSYMNNTISAEIDKPFLKDQLQSEIHIVNDTIALIWGKKVLFEIHLRASPVEEEKKNVSLNPDVELVCRMFKGHVV